ncbi:PAS domain-containing protein [Candidatus Saccharibacteria bacterium]|nr:MAG: PAS domain-containing protein [Candidatus Saccharibacteria bacterium]
MMRDVTSRMMHSMGGDIPEPNQPIYDRLKWYINMRWLLISVISLPALASLYVGPGLVRLRGSNIAFVAVLFAMNGVFYVLSRLRRSVTYYKAIAIGIVATDVLFITYFIYSIGGIESRSIIVYALPILMSSALFGRLGVYLTAGCSALLYNLVIAGNYYDWVHSPKTLTNQAHNGTYVVNTAVFFTCVLLLIAVLTDFLTRLLIAKEREANATTAALRRAQVIAKLGSWEWDVERDRTTWSDELYKIFGVQRGRQNGTYESYLTRVHPDDRKSMSTTIGQALRTHRPFRFENRIVRPDKTIRFVHGEGKVVTDKQGKVQMLYGIMQDVTDERALEIAKGDFVSLASHQLRTPASGVRMLLAMLRDGYSGSLQREQQQMVEQAYDANERLLRIADDLLNVAKLESGRIVLHPREIDLRTWLEALCIQQKLLARQERQKFIVNLPEKTVPWQVDPARLSMAIDNLLSNARKYTPARGTITVSLETTSRLCRIVVSDTGSGMTKSEMANLFGKFTRLDNHASRSTDGTGLGLYLAKSIVDMHGGTIRVQSVPGKGSTFTVRLPRPTVTK